jgi:GT2 family glycosyltransferase
MYEIVTLSKFPDIFQQFLDSANTYELKTRKVVILDPKMNVSFLDLSPSSWRAFQGVNPFIFARNANIGIRAAGVNDVVLVNDDVTFLRKDSLKALEKAAYSSPEIGIISPIVLGSVGNIYQRVYYNLRPPGISLSPKRLAFVCVYIKRSTIDLIGLLDEQFDGYGGDDDDYCFRVELAGLKLAVTTDVQVRHGYGKCESSSSFLRTMNNQLDSMMLMRKKFIAKHGVPPKH